MQRSINWIYISRFATVNNIIISLLTSDWTQASPWSTPTQEKWNQRQHTSQLIVSPT